MLYMSWPPNSFGARMQTSDTPPTRKSILAIGQVKPVGPHQRLTCSGSVQAFHTRSTGASKTRLKTRSRFSPLLLVWLSVIGRFLSVFVFHVAAHLLDEGPTHAFRHEVQLLVGFQRTKNTRSNSSFHGNSALQLGNTTHFDRAACRKRR